MRPPHESLLLELSEEGFHIWRHGPITSAYLKYLGDQVEAFRTAAMDLLEAGTITSQAEVIRGRLLTLRELQNLSLSDIQNFYRQPDTAGNDGTKADQGHPG
jgi:hypothetical protein